MKQRIVLIASVLIGIFAAFLTHQYLRAKNREVSETIARFKGRYTTVDVVVAARPLPAGSVITAADIGSLAVVGVLIGLGTLAGGVYMIVSGKKKAPLLAAIRSMET